MVTSSVWSNFKKPSPETLEVVDFEGNKRRFKLDGSEREGFCFSLQATEKSNLENGYQFKAYSYSSPHEAMAELVNKVRSKLSIRHLEPATKSEPHALLANRAAGRVASGGVVIDGTFVSWLEFTRLASTYEGWEFTVEFTS